jgi:hypothetical protein
MTGTWLGQYALFACGYSIMLLILLISVAYWQHAILIWAAPETVLPRPVVTRYYGYPATPGSAAVANDGHPSGTGGLATGQRGACLPVCGLPATWAQAGACRAGPAASEDTLPASSVRIASDGRAPSSVCSIHA